MFEEVACFNQSWQSPVSSSCDVSKVFPFYPWEGIIRTQEQARNIQRYDLRSLHKVVLHLAEM